MVRQWQTFFYDKRYSETDLSYQPNFKALAEACGGIGYDVTAIYSSFEYAYGYLDIASKTVKEHNLVYILNKDNKINTKAIISRTNSQLIETVVFLLKDD